MHSNARECNQVQSDAVRCNQTQSGAIRCTQGCNQVQSAGCRRGTSRHELHAIRGHSRPFEAIQGNQSRHELHAIRGHSRPFEAIQGNQSRHELLAIHLRVVEALQLIERNQVQSGMQSNHLRVVEALQLIERDGQPARQQCAVGMCKISPTLDERARERRTEGSVGAKAHARYGAGQREALPLGVLLHLRLSRGDLRGARTRAGRGTASMR